MTEQASELRARIVRAAADLLATGGREAVSTRAVSAAAGVQAPAIYRQFTDMGELTHAAAREILARYVRHKAKLEPTSDPLEDLRRGWDAHVAFGLANPAAYALLYGSADATQNVDAANEGYAILEAHVARLAAAGLLRVPVQRAAHMIHAGGSGVTLSLIATSPEERDARLSHAVRDAVYAAILAPRESRPAKQEVTVVTRAVALRAVLSNAPGVLSAAERQMLGEWLDRLSSVDAAISSGKEPQKPRRRGRSRVAR